MHGSAITLQHARDNSIHTPNANSLFDIHALRSSEEEASAATQETPLEGDVFEEEDMLLDEFADLINAKRQLV